MKSKFSKIIAGIAILLVGFASGFMVKSLTIREVPTVSAVVEQTAFVASLSGDEVKRKELSVNDKVFWTSLTYSEKLAYTFGFYVGYKSLCDMFNFNIGKPTNGTVKTVELIDSGYATVAGSQHTKLAEVMPKIIWMK